MIPYLGPDLKFPFFFSINLYFRNSPILGQLFQQKKIWEIFDFMNILLEKGLK